MSLGNNIFAKYLQKRFSKRSSEAFQENIELRFNTKHWNCLKTDSWNPCKISLLWLDVSSWRTGCIINIFRMRNNIFIHSILLLVLAILCNQLWFKRQILKEDSSQRYAFKFQKRLKCIEKNFTTLMLFADPYCLEIPF